MVNLPFSGTPPVAPGFWQEFDTWIHICLESLGYKLQGAPMVSVIGARGESMCSIPWRLRAKSPFLSTPLVTVEFWRRIDKWTHTFSEGPGCGLQDAPMIGAIQACGHSICSIRWRLRTKSPHFDGLVHVLFTRFRIFSMVNRICLESFVHVVFENTIKSEIR